MCWSQTEILHGVQSLSDVLLRRVVLTLYVNIRHSASRLRILHVAKLSNLFRGSSFYRLTTDDFFVLRTRPQVGEVLRSACLCLPQSLTEMWPHVGRRRSDTVGPLILTGVSGSSAGGAAVCCRFPKPGGERRSSYFCCKCGNLCGKSLVAVALSMFPPAGQTRVYLAARPVIRGVDDGCGRFCIQVFREFRGTVSFYVGHR